MQNNDYEESTLSSISKDEKIRIFLNKEQLREIVKDIGYLIDEEGYITTNENVRVLSTDNDEIQLDAIGILLPANSPHKFVKKNLGSLSIFIEETEG